MKLAFLATITLAALSMARPVDDGDSVSATAVTTSAAAAVTTDAESSTDFSTAALTTSLAETTTYAWIDLGWVNGVTSGSLTKFMGITYATAKSVFLDYLRKAYT